MKPISPIKNGKSGLLRWTHQGVRYSITWGSWDDRTQKLKLELCGKLVYEDCLLDCFDETLIRYKKWLNGAPDLSPRQKVKKLPTPIALLTIRIEENYNTSDDALLRLLQGYAKAIDDPEQAKEFVKWIKNRGVASSTLRRYLNTLKAMRKDLFGDIKVKVEEKPKAKPFDKAEVDRILTVFKEKQEYQHYHDFIIFLLNTGVRISEAIGIRWQDIDLVKREIHVFESLVQLQETFFASGSSNGHSK